MRMWVAAQSMCVGRVRSTASLVEVPLAHVLSQGVADVDFQAADHGTGVGGGAHDPLVENRSGKT